MYILLSLRSRLHLSPSVSFFCLCVSLCRQRHSVLRGGDSSLPLYSQSPRKHQPQQQQQQQQQQRQHSRGSAARAVDRCCLSLEFSLYDQATMGGSGVSFPLHQVSPLCVVSQTGKEHHPPEMGSLGQCDSHPKRSHRQSSPSLSSRDRQGQQQQLLLLMLIVQLAWLLLLLGFALLLVALHLCLSLCLLMSPSVSCCLRVSPFRGCWSGRWNGCSLTGADPLWDRPLPIGVMCWLGVPSVYA